MVPRIHYLHEIWKGYKHSDGLSGKSVNYYISLIKDINIEYENYVK